MTPLSFITIEPDENVSVVVPGRSVGTPASVPGSGAHTERRLKQGTIIFSCCPYVSKNKKIISNLKIQLYIHIDLYMFILIYVNRKRLLLTSIFVK